MEQDKWIVLRLKQYGLIAKFYKKNFTQVIVDNGYIKTFVGDIPKGLTYCIFTYMQPATGIVISKSLLPMRVPPEKIDAIAEFIVRVNNFLTIGSFNLNHADGEISFRTSVVLGVIQSYKVIETLYLGFTHAHLNVPGIHYNAFQSIIFGNIVPEEAIESIQHTLFEENGYALTLPTERDSDE